MRVLITGAAGFLGRALAAVLAEENETRLFDLVAPGAVKGHEWMTGDVTNPDDVARACAGMEAIVISHMAPNRPEIYGDPRVPFDVNVKGTAFLFASAVAAGVKRVVLISSCAAIAADFRGGKYVSRDLPLAPVGLYSLTKAEQEVIAQYHYRNSRLPVAVLRPASIMDEDTLLDKYGQKKPAATWHFVDPRDIAQVAAAALKVPDLGYEIFYMFGPAEAERHADVAYTRDRLGWKPRHDFSRWPQAAV
jgi:nucleoside-diphosphate-sugar epimerase